MDQARNLEVLENALYKMEQLIDFHREEEIRDNFPRLRKALNEARQSAQALHPPVVMPVYNEDPVMDPVHEPLRISVQTISGERPVTLSEDRVGPSSSGRLVSVGPSSSGQVVGPSVSARPPPAIVYQFPVEALPNPRSRLERAMRARLLPSHVERATRVHQLPASFQLPRHYSAPPACNELCQEGPQQLPHQMFSQPILPPSYEEAVGASNSRDLSSAALYRAIEWPTGPVCDEIPPNWNNRKPE